MSQAAFLSALLYVAVDLWRSLQDTGCSEKYIVSWSVCDEGPNVKIWY